jgi:hypothetical protein
MFRNETRIPTALEVLAILLGTYDYIPRQNLNLYRDASFKSFLIHRSPQSNSNIRRHIALSELLLISLVK